MFTEAKWIGRACAAGYDGTVLFTKKYSLRKIILRAEISVTACGVYRVKINDGDAGFPLAPGYECYNLRIPYQIYDITRFVRAGENNISVEVGKGWFSWYKWNDRLKQYGERRELIAELRIFYEDGTSETVCTDETWKCVLTRTVYSDIYNGEIFDNTLTLREESFAEVFETNLALAPFNGEAIAEHERIAPVDYFVTPKGERVLDFGQNITGYVEFSISAQKGEMLEISHAETLDKEGNFYNENYRKAKARLQYICSDGLQRYKPRFCFFGFRYIRLNCAPQGITVKNFVAIVLHSSLRRTGRVSSSNVLLNRLYENIIWGQKDNFLDIPTDCPQRDERLGWLGDAQVFCRAANYNFQCERFFARWLQLLRLEQDDYGYPPRIVPNSRRWEGCCAGWADAEAIIPFEIYRAYGNKAILKDSFTSIKKYIDYISVHTETRYLWDFGEQFGDWLGLDAPQGSYKGRSNEKLIASAFYAHSVSILIKIGEIIGENVAEYKELQERVLKAFKNAFPFPSTQTECALILYFDLTNNKEKVTRKLVDLIRDCGGHLQTGFIGTPYLLHALSDNGQTELAYELLLREDFPSWLYSVKCGATTVWEHWDGKNERGEFWAAEMNSFNHYAYGAVADWIYGVAGGILPEEAGYRKVRVRPHSTQKLDWLKVSYETASGKICSEWKHENGCIIYEIETPVNTIIDICGRERSVPAGVYILTYCNGKEIDYKCKKSQYLICESF